MCNKVVLCLKPLRAFNAVPLAQPGEVFRCFRFSVLGKMFLRSNVCLDLVKISVGESVRSANLQGRTGGCTDLVRRFVLLRLMLPMMGQVV
jgi:hypothetical protein